MTVGPHLAPNAACLFLVTEQLDHVLLLHDLKRFGQVIVGEVRSIALPSPSDFPSLVRAASDRETLMQIVHEPAKRFLLRRKDQDRSSSSDLAGSCSTAWSPIADACETTDRLDHPALYVSWHELADGDPDAFFLS
ncbi:MAG: hypothetical protein AAF670_11650 [Planctomycetota bacterium]